MNLDYLHHNTKLVAETLARLIYEFSDSNVLPAHVSILIGNFEQSGGLLVVREWNTENGHYGLKINIAFLVEKQGRIKGGARGARALGLRILGGLRVSK